MSVEGAGLSEMGGGGGGGGVKNSHDCTTFVLSMSKTLPRSLHSLQLHGDVKDSTALIRDFVTNRLRSLAICQHFTVSRREWIPVRWGD